MNSSQKKNASHQKFLFDLHNFDPDAPPEEADIEEELEPEPPPPPTFSVEELEAAKSVAYENGRREGQAEEKNAREQRIEEILSSLLHKTADLIAAETYREKQYEKECMKMGVEVIETLIPSLNKIASRDLLKSIILKTLKEHNKSDTIEIHVHPDNAADISDLISKQKNQMQYPVNILADQSLGISDCHLQWNGGGLVRDHEAIVQSVRSKLLGFVDDKTDMDTPFEAENTSAKEKEAIDFNSQNPEND